MMLQLPPSKPEKKTCKNFEDKHHNYGIAINYHFDIDHIAYQIKWPNISFYQHDVILNPINITFVEFIKRTKNIYIFYGENVVPFSA